MPCLELKVAMQPHARPVTRLRALLERPGAAVLRRHHLAEAAGQDDYLLRNRLRIAAVLAVDLINPPREEEAESSTDEDPDEKDSHAESFAKGIEIWVSDGQRAARSWADADEIAAALSMFDSWLRLARYQPALQRLEQRTVGLDYCFREGLKIGIHGNPSDKEPNPQSFFDSISAIAEVRDLREIDFSVRLPQTGLSFCHDLLQAASLWLEENSYPNILGSR